VSAEPRAAPAPAPPPAAAPAPAAPPPAAATPPSLVPADGDEFERLRRRLQLTNLRIARLYLLLKGHKAPPEGERADVLEELYVTDQEFQQHLSALSGLPPSTLHDPDASASLESIDRATAVLRRRLQAEELAARRRGQHTRFEVLCARAGLEPLDQEILLIILAPEIDRRYRRVFAYLHDDFTRGIPSVGLVVDILAPVLGSTDRLGILSRFEAGSPLIRRGLVELLPARADDVKPLAQRHVRVGDAASGWVLGVPRMADAIADRARWAGVPEPPPATSLPADARDRVADLAERVRSSTRGVTVFMVSKEIAGSRAAADLLCHELGRPVVRLEISTFLGGGERVLEDIGQVLKDAFLFGAVLNILGFPDVEKEEPPAMRNLETVWRRVQDYDGHIVVPVRTVPPAARLVEGRHATPWEIENPGFHERIRVLEALLSSADLESQLSRAEVEALANRYRLGRQQLQQAVAYARDVAWSRRPDKERLPEVFFDDVVLGCRAQFSRDIGGLARRIEPRFTLAELVLPPREKGHLSELLAFVERRGQVYESWGFDSKFPRGTGAKALFFGRSGTGKTMAAEVIAKRLGLDLFKVDLSTVISKWVGETEKNLASIFDRAEEAQAVLLFDEADALFGQRTNVGNAVDRYANLETNYLLQRIEEYDGIAILSSNFKQNIDEAFTRRFHFIIEFPFPDRDAREEIWQRAFPTQAPLADDVDFAWLADKYKFTGGNIKNSVLRAAFLGASDGVDAAISMKHILQGVLREYQNLEREPTEREFGQFWPLLKHLVDENKGAKKKERPS
jgi:hypothetical protein